MMRDALEVIVFLEIVKSFVDGTPNLAWQLQFYSVLKHVWVV